MLQISKEYDNGEAEYWEQLGDADDDVAKSYICEICNADESDIEEIEAIALNPDDDDLSYWENHIYKYIGYDFTLIVFANVDR